MGKTAGAEEAAGVVEAERVVERLRRIRELERAGAPVTILLGELRELVGDAESWARREGDERAETAATALAGRLDRIEEVQLDAVAIQLSGS